MKKTILLLTIAFTLSSAALYAADANRWVLLARSVSEKDFYIDSSSVQYQLLKKKLTLKEEELVSAWFKIVPGQRNSVTDNFIEKYINEEVGYATALIETNCSNSTLRVLVINMYDRDNKFARRIETLTSTFGDIPRGCVFEDIKKIICRQ